MHSAITYSDSLTPAAATADAKAGWPGIAVASLPVTVCRNPAVMPPGVGQCSMVFDPLDIPVTEPSWGYLELFSELERPTPTRRFEFLVGRLCAAKAMGAGAVAKGLTLCRGASGAPIWPAGMTGSITHTVGFVSAVAAPCRNGQGIGIDSEEILSRDRAARIAAVFATQGEIGGARDAGLDAETATTLVFSAKESVYKALHASVGRVFDYHDVRIIELDGRRRHFTAVLQHALSAALPSGTRLSGRYDIDRRRVHTGMMVAPLVRE